MPMRAKTPPTVPDGFIIDTLLDRCPGACKVSAINDAAEDHLKEAQVA